MYARRQRLFVARLRPPDGYRQCLFIGADRKQLARDQNGAFDPNVTSTILERYCATHLPIPSKGRKQPIMMSLQSLNWSGDRTCARSLDILLTAIVWAAGISSRWRALRL